MAFEEGFATINKGSTGGSGVTTASLFTGVGILGPIVGTIYDNGDFYVLLYDLATTPGAGATADLVLGPFAGPTAFPLPPFNVRWMFEKGCQAVLSSTAPTYTAAGSTGFSLAWQWWKYYNF